MKRIGFLMAIVLVLGMSNTYAQKIKLGHVQVDTIFQMMPERTQAEQELQAYSKQLEEQLVTMNSELEKMYNAYMELPENTPATVKGDKEQELTGLQQRIQNFQMRAQSDLQTKEAELLQPIYEKIKNAIEKVSSENGFTYIYDASTLLYKSPDSENITPLVKSKLGL